MRRMTAEMADIKMAVKVLYTKNVNGEYQTVTRLRMEKSTIKTNITNKSTVYSFLLAEAELSLDAVFFGNPFLLIPHLLIQQSPLFQPSSDLDLTTVLSQPFWIGLQVSFSNSMDRIKSTANNDDKNNQTTKHSVTQ